MQGKRTTVAVDILAPHPMRPLPRLAHLPALTRVCCSWAEESESWVLQGRSQPVRLRDCRPRHKSFASGEATGKNLMKVGKSILLVTVSSESGSLLWTGKRQKPRVKGCFPRIINNK